MAQALQQGLARYLSAAQLAYLGQAKIGIAGAGGLGSNCAYLLVRSGIRQLRIVDFDVIEPSNLNRQLYWPDDVGRLKVTALRERLMLLEPALQCEALALRVTDANAGSLFADCDVVIEALDQAADKCMLAEQYAAAPMLFVAASGLGGWGQADTIRTRRLQGDFYVVGNEYSAADGATPPLAPQVMVAAAKQADVVINYLLAKAGE